MSYESIAGFAVTMFILAATPGPGVFATVSQALSSGFRPSLDVIAGMVLGDITFLLFAVFGLTAAARVMGEMFFIIKIAGSAYLIWLGWKMWTAAPVEFNVDSEAGRRSGWQRFLAGLLITLGNPKVILFYAGFVPTFLDLTALKPQDIAMIVVTIAIVLSTVMGTYAYCASRARRLFTGQRASRYLNRSAGTVMIGTGIAIAAR